MFEVVTTFHQEKHGYFADNMLKTFEQYWPKSINIFAYVENKKQTYRYNKNIIIKDFDDISSNFKLFEFNYKSKEANTINKSYKFQAIRFAHKIFAILAHLNQCKSEFLIWLDSDVISVNKLSEKFLSQFTGPDIYFSYLGRDYINFHSEAGFMIFNTKNSFHNIFWDEMREMYINGKLFNEKEWHDSYIFDVVRKKLEIKNMKSLDISSFGLKKGSDPLEVLDNSELGKYLRHLKGKRKVLATNL